MGYGSFFKGETKKKKKGQGGKPLSSSGPVFIPPKIVPKGKEKY